MDDLEVLKNAAEELAAQIYNISIQNIDIPGFQETLKDSRMVNERLIGSIATIMRVWQMQTPEPVRNWDMEYAPKYAMSMPEQARSRAGSCAESVKSAKSVKSNGSFTAAPTQRAWADCTPEPPRSITPEPALEPVQPSSSVQPVAKPNIKKFKKKPHTGERPKVRDIEYRPGMYLAYLHEEDKLLISINNMDELMHVRFYFRDPDICDGFDGIWKYNKYYMLGEDGFLYIVRDQKLIKFKQNDRYVTYNLCYPE